MANFRLQIDSNIGNTYFYINTADVYGYFTPVTDPYVSEKVGYYSAGTSITITSLATSPNFLYWLKDGLPFAGNTNPTVTITMTADTRMTMVMDAAVYNTFTIDIGSSDPSTLGGIGSAYVAPTSPGTYSYLWDTGDVTGTIAAVPGIYHVVITELTGAYGVSVMNAVAMIRDIPGTIVVDLTISYLGCGGATSQVVGSASGGLSPYEYSIDGTTWQSSDTFTGLPSGDYTLYAKDSNGLLGGLPFIINIPTPNTLPMIRKYTDKSFFREHPYADPAIQSTPNQVEAFIFPGDEITMCHKVCLPCDAIVTNINDVNLISAKCSIVAVKPQVFSEEFSDVFQSTRTFELDSVTTLFNGVNAPYIPYGADGVARSLQVLQDRIFKLAAGDFHRQIKYFTTHVNGTQEWYYNFYFPILFRWEYWQALLTAHNDFFDTAQPLNGKNHFWEKYFVNGVWKLQSRLDLTCLVQGVPTVIRCMLDIATTPGNVNDYSSNSDWINKSIKTNKVGGTPSNAPCVIYSNEDTEVFGYFEKVSGWAADEQANMSAVMWIEPFEGGGITQRTRGSSIYEVGAETVFKGLSLSLSDDNGIGITDENGNYIIVDAAGKGAILYFDGTSPELLRVFAIIDKTKLAAIYPNATKFKLYCRLYNGTTPISAPIMGEEITQVAVMVANSIGSSSCVRNQPLCPYDLKVFASLDNDLDLENDKSDFLYFGDPLVSNIQFTLQKNLDSCSSGTWSDVVTISGSNYGQYFPFGKSLDFLNTDFTDEFNKKYTGLMLNWKNVLTDFGTGLYRMKITYTDTSEVDSIVYDNRLFCLSNYHCSLADKTVRIETVNVGLRGSLSDRLNYTDYSTGWNGQVRLDGILRYRESTYNTEYSVYGQGMLNVQKPYIDEQKPKFTLSLKQIPGWMQWYVSTKILQADSIIVTDYNLSNDHGLIQMPLIKDGAFSPVDNKLANPLSSVTIPMAYANDNLRLQNS